MSLYNFSFFEEEKLTDCSIEDVLVFFSGTDRVPPLNFEKQPTITLHNAYAKFATASTCDLQLRLPTGYGEDYDAFKSAMVMALKDNDGFGGV